MKLFGKKFALVLALIAVFALAGSALAANTYYVASGGNDTNNSGTSADAAFATVAHAIETAAAGDVINVGPGRFEVKNITLNKVLEIVGAGADGTDEEKTTFYAELSGTNGNKSMIMISGDNLGGTKISGVCFEIISTNSVARSENDVAISYRASGTEDNNIVITECAFVGKASSAETETSAIAISSTTGGFLTFSNNTLDNLKYGMYFNQINDVDIIGNVITNTQYNAINIAADSETRKCYGITITDNTMSNIATNDWYTEEYSSGVRIGDYGTSIDNHVSNNEINMADSSRQEFALYGTNVPTQCAQVATLDGHKIYFATLTEAIQSEKTVDNSTITLLTAPTEEDAKVVIDKNVTIDRTKAPDYTPNLGEGAEIVENEDGTITIVQPSPEPTPETSGSGGGGCSAGFGALALLAAVPLMFRRKR